MEKDELIGNKIQGFSFDEDQEYGHAYNNDMDIFIGVEGEIIAIEENYVNVMFDDDFWLYPIVLIHDHLID